MSYFLWKFLYSWRRWDRISSVCSPSHWLFSVFQARILYSNTETEYVSLIIGLIYALQMGVHRILCKDFLGSLLKKSSDIPFWKKSLMCLIELLSEKWSDPDQESISSMCRKYITTWWCISHSGFKTWCSSRVVDMRIIKKTLQATTVDSVHSDPFDEQDWRNSIIQSLNHPPSTMVVKDLKDFIYINGKL